jgi:hypothetical protein
MSELFDYSSLPAELRLQVLGLPLPARPVGRPRKLSFKEQVKVGIRLREVYDGFARFGRSTQHPKLPSLVKRIRQMLADDEAWRAARLSREADDLGRFHSTPILKPAENLPVAYRVVAEEFGIKPRMVRSVHEDKRIVELVGLPAWELKKETREWLEGGAQRAWVHQRRAWVRRRASQLLTPEYLFKVYRGEVVLGEAHGGLAVQDELRRVEHLLTPEQYRKGREFQQRCYAGGQGHLVMGRWIDFSDVDPWDDGVFPPVLYIRRAAGGLPASTVRNAGGEKRSSGGEPHSYGAHRGLVLKWQNVALAKIRSQADYNQQIIDRIGLHELKFLRAALHESSFEIVGYRMGARSPEEARNRTVAALRKLLDRL